RLLRASLERVLATGAPDEIAFIPYNIPRGDGPEQLHEERYWSATHTPIRGPNGEVQFVVQHTVDVTDVYRAEHAQQLGHLSPVEGVLRRAERIQSINTVLDAERDHLVRLF